MTGVSPREQRSLRESYIIEASAGTGKTSELVCRIADVLASGAAVDAVVAVTFTNAAAGEMKLRVRQEIDQRLRSVTDAETHANLGRALQGLERAFIGTIHSFCARLLRQRPVEAGVDPAFEELAQPAAVALFDRVFREWMRRRLSTSSPALARAFARLAWLEDRHIDPMERLQSAAWNLTEWRDHATAWDRRPFERESEIERLIGQVQQVLQLRRACARPERDGLYRSLAPLADFVERVERRRETAGDDYDAWEAEVLRLPGDLRFLQRGYGVFSPAVTREAVIAAWENLKREIDEFGEKADADLASALRDELWEVVPLYQAAKQRAGQLDFMDLLIGARNLLQNRDALRDFRAQYRHIFIDEFQDTDPLQAEILMALSSSPDGAHEAGRLFLVGDPKQSIYRFRRADVEMYRDIRDRLLGSGARADALQNSHRSLASIQRFVNAAFRDMPEYLPLTGGREGVASQPSVVALPMPKPFGVRNLSKVAINTCAPHTVGAFVDWLIHESNWTVTERHDPDRRVPIAARHICILFRRFTNRGVDLTQDYVRSLEARSIAHVLVGSKAFHQREEVAAIRTALNAVEWPDDELSVFATLRAFAGIPDSTLFKYRTRYQRLHPYHPPPSDRDDEFEQIEQLLELLAELHRRRNYRPFADTINHLLEFTRAHAAFVFRKGGKRVLANVQRLADLAREFETAGATSFRSFVEYLEAEFESGEGGEAPILEPEADGVKLMTVHRAKGLEFPVVILADLTAHLTGDGGDRHVRGSLCAQRLLGCAPWELLQNARYEAELDRAEAVRVAYVAATRARDLLVVSAVGDREFYNVMAPESWLGPLYPALYPSEDLWRTSGPAPGCPGFRAQTVFNRPPDNDGESIKPGLHYGSEGREPVVWFDPSILDLDDRKDLGLANEKLLIESSQHASAGLERYQAWQAAREDMIARGSRPRFEVVSASTAAAASEIRVAVEHLSVRIAGERPKGRKFGRLVHALLESRDADLETTARVCAREMGATEREASAAIEAVRQAQRHPILQEASRAGRIHSEFPVMVTLSDGRLVEGRVDLAFSDGSQWTVVDFKTGDSDEQQLQLYACALRQASGLPVRAVLLEV